MVTLQAREGGVVVSQDNRGDGVDGEKRLAAAGGVVASSKLVPAFAVEAPPPVGNTGGKLTKTIKLDWLNGSFPAAFIDVVRAHVSDFLGPAEHREYGFYTYQESWAWPTGAVLCFTEGRAEAMLSLNGDSLDWIPLKKQRGLLADLLSLGLRASRVDVAHDDYGGDLRLDDVEAAAAAGNFTGYRVVQTHRPQRFVGGVMSDEGRGVSFGRRGKDGGGRFVQVYDKGLESKGDIPSVRIELRTAKEHADELFRQLAGAASDDVMGEMMCRAVGGSIDFVERGTETHVDRMPRLAWWSRVVAALGQARIVVHRVIPPLQKTWEHIKKNILPSMALVRSVVQSTGYADFLDLLEDQLDAAERKIRWAKQGRRDLGLNLVECFG